MGSTTFCVHGGLPDETVFLPSFHELQTICIVSDGVFCQPFYEDSINFGLMDVQSLGFGKILQQVIDLFIVDLKEGTIDSEFWLFFFVHFYFVEKFKNCPGNESSKIFIRTQVFKESVLPF